jgi:apolipoprotein N-acyltransferase
MQLTSVTGIWGVTFVIALVPAALAAAWTRRAWPALAPAALIVAGVFAFGAVRLQERPPGASVRVGLAASDRSIEAGFATKNPSVAVSVAQAYAGRIARLSAAGAQVVILPEKFVAVTPADAPEVLAVFSDAARTAQVTVIAGINRSAITPARNAAVVYAPDGSLLTEYDKHHLVPGLERGYETGAAPALFEAPGGPWGVAICKDMDFPAWSRLYARRGALLMAVPAWDFVVDARLHSRMAVVRGIEHGFGIARTAQQGALTLSDAYGRILAETRTANAAEALLTADIYPGPGATFYTRFGDWFGWLNILALLALIAGALSRPALAAP